TMASWIWAASPFDLLVDKATSPNLPIGTEDIATSLEIADQIRAKSVLPKAAVASLKRKVGDKNPNVQKLSFGLIDCCIKNGGDHFLAEVAARDFIDNLASILKLQSTNAEVKRVGLDLFQQWALAFQSKPELSYVCEVYRGMKDEGISFPPPPTISNAAALLSTSTAPAWIDSEVCLRCRTPFSFTNRKHHCRNCGKVFDQGCSSHLMPLPHFGIVEEVRVCDGCWGKSKTGGLAKQASLLHAQKQAAAGPAPAIPRKSHHPDSDLARAIALSLAESQASSGTNRPGFVPTVSEPPIRGGRKEEGTDGEEDEDLRAAIEASLKEMRDAPSAPVGVGEEGGGEERRSVSSAFAFSVVGRRGLP
ncbi:hypothetical protein BDY24DRAFT_339617, partial [Mrakia frigida]|uniref:uncharacterized protein n=1 Tax=Mrakia frigida TaxID=29902 RepID=UPI003FCC2663